MPKVFEYQDQELGSSYIVVSKIREISKTLGEIILTFDNGDTRVLSVANPDETLAKLLQAIRA
ncbi:MAG: hypothetical protein PWP64_857 [Candidatus Cloacimonadota bacterium]|jgi:hypothetical protein|nr:hypothetical protein [Candidatus Cloacimonadota bacterium]